MKAKMETELIADCHGGTEVNLVTALGFYSMFGSLESLLNLEQKHEMVSTISVEVASGSFANRAKVYWKVEGSDRGGSEHRAQLNLS